MAFADGGLIESILEPGSSLTMKLATGIIGDIQATTDDAPEE
ncbi:hypothetical protein QTL95_10300 [Rhizobium sp. S152]|nr:hypothetical protein [Rhizobium sp. S152]MDM9626289.1 hypothetical protein [Rhizobium sp. S152]